MEAPPREARPVPVSTGSARALMTGAWVFLVVGMALSAWAGWALLRWTGARDRERFDHEAEAATSAVEQKMERYEMALNRIQDFFAPTGGLVSNSLWSAVTTHTVAVADNLPNILVMGVGHRLRATNGGPDEVRVVIAQGYHGHRPLPRDTDLLKEEPGRPSMKPALGGTFGWIGVGSVERVEEGRSDGVWFVLPLRPPGAVGHVRWVRPGETEQSAAPRRARQRDQATDGLLATFIGGDEFLREFNQSTNAMVHLALYPAREMRSTGRPLNPGHASPPAPRFVGDRRMRWYGNDWVMRVSSLPRMEAQSLRYRAWLAWLLGPLMSVAGCVGLAGQARARARERELSARLAAALREQERLSRDLHDGTLQSVYAVGLGVARAQLLAQRGDASVPGQLRQVGDAVQGVIGELRGFLQRSGPASGEPDEIDLGDALRAVVRPVQTGAEASIDLDLQHDVRVPPGTGLQLVNIAREALSNAVRHARARRIVLRVTRDAEGTVGLEVADDGIGFEPETTIRGKGLQNIAERVRELGGELRWERPEGGGLRMRVRVTAMGRIAPDGSMEDKP